MRRFRTSLSALLLTSLLTSLLAFPVASLAQDTPGTGKYPPALNSADSLIRAADNATTKLKFSLPSGAATMTVLSTASFPASGVLWLDGREVVIYTAKTGTTFTGLLRGQQGTTALVHAAGISVEMRISAIYHNTLSQAIRNIEAKLGTGNSTASSGYLPFGTGPGASAWRAMTAADIAPAEGDVYATSYANMAAALTAISTTNKRLIISGTFSVAASATVPVNVELAFTGNGQISVASGQTLTINSTSRNWPLRTIFSGLGSVRFGTNVEASFPQFFGAKMDGTTDDAAAIQKAIDASQATVVISASTAIAVDLTMPGNISLVVTGGGSFNISSTKTLTINGPLVAPLRQVFAGAGGVVFGGARTGRAIPQYWGALGDGSTDDTPAFISAMLAIAAAKGTVFIPNSTGEYLIDGAGSIPLTVSGVTFEGESCAGVVLKRTDTSLPLFYNQSGEVHDLTFKNFTINKHGVNGYGWVFSGDSSHLRFSNIRIIGMPPDGVGIAMSHANYVKVEDCVFEGDGGQAGQAVNISGSNHIEVRRCRFWYMSSGVSVGTDAVGQPSEDIEFSDNYGDSGWFSGRARFSASTGTSYTSTVLTKSGAGFSGLSAGDYVRVMPVRRTSSGGAVTYSASKLTDTAADFITSGVKRGDIVRSGSAFGIVASAGIGQTAMMNTASAGATALYVNIEKPFIVGSKVRVVLDNGSIHHSTVTAVTFFHLTIADAIPVGRTAPAGNRVDSSQDTLIIEEWLSDSDRQPIANPGAGASYTAYGTILGSIASFTSTTLTISRWHDLDGNTATTPSTSTLFEVLYRPSYLFHVEGLTNKVSVLRNRLRRTYADMISVYGYNARITDNFLLDCQDTAITIHGANNIISGNYILRPGVQGIWANGDDMLITDNQILESSGINGTTGVAGIVLWTGDRCRVSHNRIQNSSVVVARNGVLVVSVGDGTAFNDAIDNVVEFNTISGFVDYDILVSTVFGGNVTGTVLRHNQATTRGFSGCTARIEEAGSGSPEGSVVGDVGSIWRRTNGSSNATLYIKENGTGNTGWAANVSMNSPNGSTVAMLGTNIALFHNLGGMQLNSSLPLGWASGDPSSTAADVQLRRIAAAVIGITDASTGGGALQFPPKAATPANPSSSAEGNIYIKGGKLVVQYNDGGVTRYKFLDLTGVGVTWTHTTSAP